MYFSLPNNFMKLILHSISGSTDIIEDLNQLGVT